MKPIEESGRVGLTTTRDEEGVVTGSRGFKKRRRGVKKGDTEEGGGLIAGIRGQSI